MLAQRVSPSDLRTGLCRCHVAVQDFLASNEAEPAAMPADLARLTSVDGDLTMTTRAYRSRHYQRVAVAVIRDLVGNPITLTVVGIPKTSCSAPIIGVDLIGLRGQLSLCALDLAPTISSVWESRFRPLLDQVAVELEGLPRRKLPAFAAETFSSRAQIVAARPGQELSVARATEVFFYGLADALADESEESRCDTRFAVSAWCASELNNRKEAKALSSLFGPHVASDYLGGFLFSMEQYQ